MLEARLERVRERMRLHHLEQLVITQPQSIYYLTGEWVEPHDRMDALIIDPGECRMLCYNLAVIQPDNCAVSIYSDTGETIARLSALLKSVPTGVDGYLHARFLLPLMDARPDLRLAVSSCVEEARMIKDADEIARLRRASEITDAVFEDSFAQVREGMTELELGGIFSDSFDRHGAGRVFGDPMVSFGVGTSNPHHAPVRAKLCAGDTIWVDTGKRIDGYFSDMTRTVFFQRASDEQRKIYDIVLESNLAAIDAVRPGVPIGEIHQVACRVIEKAGYREFFTHRTSHGIGIDYHEEPFDTDARVLPVEPGMCFSIEPGIYLPGRFGVRVEDLVVVTETGCSLLSHAPKEFRILK